MSALTVWQGLEERFRTVSGLQNIILGESTALHELPCLYTVLESFERTMASLPPADNLTAMHYHFTHRLVIRWQDYQQAEMQLLSFINAIPAAVDADATLGGRITRGNVRITDGVAGFVDIGGVKYRIVDFATDALEKDTRSSGI